MAERTGDRRWARPNRSSALRLCLGFVLLAALSTCLVTANATKLRHSKHPNKRQLATENQSTFPQDFEQTQDNYNNNKKPVFKNCSNYAPVIEEEQPVGTEVIQVHAEIENTNGKSAIGNITYRLLTSPEEILKFEIGSIDGVIRTKQILDRDEPQRDKEQYLNVIATSHGQPEMDDYCSFKVTIKDINDNAPMFDKVAYVESVPLDFPVGREVMRVSATDLDDKENSVVRYTIRAVRQEDEGYFFIDETSGVIYLNKTIDKNPNYKFSMVAEATDQGKSPQFSAQDIEIRVVPSSKKIPNFVSLKREGREIPFSEHVRIPEDYNDYQSGIVRLKAESNIIGRPNLRFEIIRGYDYTITKNGTPSSNADKRDVFSLKKVSDNEVDVVLFAALDYEVRSEYNLRIRVENYHQMAAETVINIDVTDVNDNMPKFVKIVNAVVLENQPIGTPVMQVQARDADGTPDFNQVVYSLDKLYDSQKFAIDKYTGNITTRVIFDKEAESTYSIVVIASDQVPSSLNGYKSPNEATEEFSIFIGDVNDNPPKFSQALYTANSIMENTNVNALVTEVQATDADSDSVITYSIISGNINDSFSIESTTGTIRVNKPLDYEKITQYLLTVKAYDGIYNATTQVKIFIENVNDNPPVFKNFNTNPVIEEQSLMNGTCITKVDAYDPDKTDRDEDQEIVYSIVKEHQRPFITIDDDGCMKLKKPLDRDPPNGYPVWTILVGARDENGGPTALREVVSVNITLKDINDNAPFLNMSQPVVWNENQDPGVITALSANDYDGPDNGPPFEYSIDVLAGSDIRSKFEIRDKSLVALVRFDREERKSYNIPIAIRDSGVPPMTGTSTLTVIIGDINDNKMKEGESSIFVYNYMGKAPTTQIGRVYVDDPDDWDLPDKNFAWDSDPGKEFELDRNTGMITMRSGTSNGTYHLKFIVTEKGPFMPERHTVKALVNVTVKEIPDEAVTNSGSVRFLGVTTEEFIMPNEYGVSKRDKMQRQLAGIFNVSRGNIDIFTVLHSPHHNNRSLLDVRFAVHNSPYWPPEELNTKFTQNLKELEREIEVDVYLVNIDECLFEMSPCIDNCRNLLNKSSTPSAVYTNTSSFVGVTAVVDPLCTCHIASIVCLNGGTPVAGKCECPPGYDGPNCEELAISFQGEGYAVFPSPGQSCSDSHLSLDVSATTDNGLIFYLGPLIYNPKLVIQDFMALEVRNGYATLFMDYGTGTIKLDHHLIKLTDGKSHKIEIFWTKNMVQMNVDKCKTSKCLKMTVPAGVNKLLNVNGPLQIGGTLSKLNDLAGHFGWNHTPTSRGFSGCIYNVTFNAMTYDLRMPKIAKNAESGCVREAAKATFGIDTNFLVAILVCVATLLILLLAVMVHRRKTDDMYKDMDDIRENIINYEDEGGGEVDTGYDLNVLRSMYPPMDMKGMDLIIGQNPVEERDICGFLDGKKENCDKDPDCNPFDDVRHYAYEGEGNSEGSLSSLASCTDDGDLKFNYLSNFGPRFRKLADMCGEDPSDEESEGVGERESESWC